MSVRWLIKTSDGTRHECGHGQLEGILMGLRAGGCDEFTVQTVTLDPGTYVPELQREDVPDTIPEEWSEGDGA